ncbi:ATP-grasp domain-containing protein [Streptomyces sp. NPDC059398]|uniref:ATP-grasp domain-containing protein n=1 Tax=Streptomyces sp. NPDC059398 TaxID=3346820 RepID=UPI00367DD1EA
MSTLVFVESSYTGAGADCARIAVDSGHEVVLVCRDAVPYAFAGELGLRIVTCDTTDPDAVTAVIADLPDVRAVGTTDDYSGAVVAAVAERLGLPGPSPSVAAACRDKHALRRALPAELSPGWRYATSPQEAVSAARKVGYPVVAKPTNLTGSALVAVRRSDEEVLAHAEAAFAEEATRDTPRVAGLLIEEFVDGPEFSVEFMDGAVIGLTGKHLVPGPGFVELGHDFPARVGDDIAAVVLDAAGRATAELGLNWGPAHMEMRYGPDGPVVIEVNARIPGDRIPRLIELTTGFSFAESYVRRLLGEPLPARRSPVGRAASIRMWCLPGEGTLREIRGVAETAEVPGVQDLEFRGVVGRHYTPKISNLDRIGHVITCADTGEEAVAAAETALATVRTTWGE